MTDQELSKWLAERIMKWICFKSLMSGIPDSYCTTTDNIHFDFIMYIDDWNPVKNIKQAFMVVEEMDDCLHLKQHGEHGNWSANFCGCTQEAASADIPEMAICLAAYKGWNLVK